ncbi:NYN domain-containing protein [Clostridium sp. 19966]|uniref:NYN domain-containing protein n=1 Tax=Clostridium sp. 19966 TaxID=2768166 RepID=UPI0028DE2167|nr:NYN domain-containing protein [Clostridium sp. 19966]MDT8715797.1 NYN domain-containing protein [Clostridium sp. 19966]
MKIVFVDGYNVINAWPKLKNMKDFSYEAARQKLTDIMMDYSSFYGCRVFVVFDAHKVPKSLEKKERHGNVTIVFTKEGETADNFIEKSVDSIGKKIDVCVVTSDALEQMLTFQRGATRMSSIEFLREIEAMQVNIQNKTQKKFADNRNLLEDTIEKNVLEKLEKIRRSH